MSSKFWSFLYLSILIISCDDTKQVALQTSQIIPAPMIQQNLNGVFYLNDDTVLDNEAGFTKTADYFKTFIGSSSITLENGSSSSNVVKILKDESIDNMEAYTLEVTPGYIQIKASTDAGAFYAIQSLLQLMDPQIEKTNRYNSIPIPAVKIEDEPRFKYRGMHLDVSRHMFDVDFIKKYIDAMAMLKMNNFHWHLTDDQGWRIEIKKYPKLQEVAAYRDSTLVGHYNDTPHQYDGKRYGGHYTQEEVREVIAFAKARHINVIPEIEMPGHAQAAIAAYPELGCSGENIQVAMKWGVFEDIYCPNEATFTFLENVLDEVIELFPSKYIHIGGDEAPKTQWKTSDVAQKVIKENGLKDEYELQSYFIQRMEKYINSKGRQIIGWDEILEGGLAPNATVMSWRGVEGAIEAAKAGHDVIMTPTSHCYFDYYQSENDDEPLAIGGFLPLEKVYNFNPIPEELTAEEAQLVLGVQGNVWSEYIKTSEQVEYMVFPRIFAMSEVAWSPSSERDYLEFVSRVENFNKRLEVLNINYANHLYELEGYLNEDQGYELITMLSNKRIRFTLDGTLPVATSTVYEDPIPFKEDMSLKAAVFENGEQLSSSFTQEFHYHKGVGATISINKEPHKSYSGSGAAGLINGIKGSDSRYGDREWLGFSGDDLEIEITFNEPTEINSIDLRFYHGPGQWIYSPEKVFINMTLESGNVLTDMISINPESKNLVNINYDAQKVLSGNKGKSIKLKIPNYGTIPDGNQGAGNKAWTFIDEIIIK